MYFLYLRWRTRRSTCTTTVFVILFEVTIPTCVFGIPRVFCAVAVVVSVANSCAYCIAAHSAALRKLTKDPPLADQIATDYAQAGLSDRMKRALDYSLKLTRSPDAMAEEDVQRLRDAGWTDEDVMDITEVTALFNFSNRMASGLGWQPNPEYETVGR